MCSSKCAICVYQEVCYMCVPVIITRTSECVCCTYTLTGTVLTSFFTPQVKYLRQSHL